MKKLIQSFALLIELVGTLREMSLRNAVTSCCSEDRHVV